MVEKEVKIKVAADVDDKQVKELEDLLDSLADKVVGFEVAVEDGEIDGALEKEDELNTTAEVDIEVNDAGIQVAMQNIKDGFSSIKQGASEVGAVLNDALASAGKQETNKTFLEQALGDPKTAEKKIQDINGIVQNLPGDDSVMQGLLGQAVAKDASLTTKELTEMGGAASDYFAAMKNYGKSSSEAFQDMNNYLMTGNTAEIERSPILANHIDKLKEGTTIQERSALLQEALNEEHWGGISAQDTYNNKLETFNGMLERGQYTLGGMFQEGAKGAMDFALQLDDATGGLVGMGIAAVGFASPLSDMVIGVGQMSTGLKAIKDAGAVTALAEMLPFIVADEEAFLGLALAEDFALWPIIAIIAAIALLGAAVYELGKYFGWWTDAGTMVDAVSAGVQRLWSAFINNPDVQSFIQGIKDAWNGVVAALGPVISQVMSFLGISQGGEFDIVRALIDGVGNAWRNIKPAIMLIIQAITVFVGYVSNGIARAKQIIQTLQTKWTAVKNGISGAASGIKSALTAPFQQAWGVVKPIYDKFETAVNWGKQLIGWSGVEYAGFSTDNVGYAGFGSEDTLNSTLSSIANNSTNNSNITNNFNINGIIEEEASQFIVSSVNDHIKKQNLIRGV